MKVIICGGRNVGRTDPNALHLDAASEVKRATAARRFVTAKMDELHVEKQFGKIIAGNEGGAERLGITWAVFKRIPHRVFERKSRGETAVERNIRMLRESQPDLVIAFDGDESTTALLMEAKRLGVPALEIALPQC
jgi:hypothetical protein